MRVVIAGAGASKGTVDAPISDGFGAHLEEILPGWRLAFPALAGAVREWAQLYDGNPTGWPLHGVWTLVDNYAKLHAILNRLNLPALRPEISIEVRCAILQVYGATILDRLPAEPNGTIALVLRQLQAGDVVISMNYDTVVEATAQRLGIPVTAADPHRGLVAYQGENCGGGLGGGGCRALARASARAAVDASQLPESTYRHRWLACGRGAGLGVAHDDRIPRRHASREKQP